jgi:DNA helicase MCM8
MKLAAHQVIFRYSGLTGLPYSDRQIVIRISNYQITPLCDIRANYIDKFISIKGTVVRVSPIKPIVFGIEFICERCGARIPMIFPDGRWKVPTKCNYSSSDGNCRSKIFIPDRRSADCVDWQRIRIQEIITDYKDSGRIPRTIECELTEDLVGICVPGFINSFIYLFILFFFFFY